MVTAEELVDALQEAIDKVADVRVDVAEQNIVKDDGDKEKVLRELWHIDEHLGRVQSTLEGL